MGAGEVDGRGAVEGVVGSEFAEVSVRIDTAGNGARLRLEDAESGRVRYLDALELQTLVWLPEGHLRQLLDPSADRWREVSREQETNQREQETNR